MPPARGPPGGRGQVLPVPRDPAGPDRGPGSCVRRSASGARRSVAGGAWWFRQPARPGRRPPRRGAGWGRAGDGWGGAGGGQAFPPAGHAYPAAERAAVYRVIEERRDVRQGFLPDPVPPDVLRRVLDAAHRSPSVGLSQPWDFIVITDRARRERIKALAARAAGDYAASLPAARATAFDRLKIEAILEAPVAVVVTCDPTRGGRHTLGRQSQPQTAAYSSGLAVASLWLSARAGGLRGGLGGGF